MNCAMRKEGPDQCSETELKEENWQGKIENHANKLTIFQDTMSLNAWDNEFGAGHDDLMVYFDGKVYKYLPASMNKVEGEVFADANLNQPDGYAFVKSLVLRAFQEYGSDSSKQWCGVAAEVESSSVRVGDTNTEKKKSISSKAKKAPRSEPRRGHSALYYTLEGFLFGATGIVFFIAMYHLFKKYALPHLKKKFNGGSNRKPSGKDGGGQFGLVSSQDDTEYDEELSSSALDGIELPSHRMKEKDEGPDLRTMAKRKSQEDLTDEEDMNVFVADRIERLDIDAMEQRIAEQFQKTTFV
uniref:Uncharacterized protein n=1 Tax=Leptocylindrus danicus TaxID=163516 RepID=A0A7S2LFI4_9STRA|mmetsp:Transcript_5000/g.7331  ORF Transcript_5000/g.7331 Transcript_5000/m.7331 type:complete len:299 (+) Transcript_5000:400-1296(+)